jgi:transcriptional regulator with XRE-family HTH domain
MSYWLGVAARELREGAHKKHVHVAATADVDQSTIWRFESGKAKGFPRDLDTIIAAYAKTLDINPSEIWALAVGLWRHFDDEVVLKNGELAALAGQLDGLIAGVFAALPRSRDAARRARRVPDRQPT